MWGCTEDEFFALFLSCRVLLISVIVFPRVDAERWSNRPRPYVDLRNQCPVDRTFIGDLEQPGTLFPG